MFNKKEIDDVQQTLKHLQDKHELHHKETKEQLTNILEQFRKELSPLKNQQDTHHQELSKSLQTINELTNRYKKELETLSLFKNQLTEKTLEKVDKELKTELQKHLLELKTEKEHFKELKTELDTMKLEIQRMTGIIQKVKEADLELKAAANKIAEQEEEKSRLLKRLSDLQDIIGKNRERRSLY